MKHKIAALFIALGLAFVSGSLAKAEPPVVVELFTSQGCYSCPPAEAYLGELSKTAEIVALEFHVDYWDDLAHGGDGKWKDVFSRPEFTQHQRIYAGNFPNGQVYTPQMVVGGHGFAVGSNRRAVRRLIAQAKEIQRGATLTITKKPGHDLGTNLSIDITGRSNRPLSI